MPAPIVAAAGKAVAATGKVVAKTAAAVAKAASQVAAKVGSGMRKAVTSTAKSTGQVAAKTSSTVAKGTGQTVSSTAKATGQLAKGTTATSQAGTKASAQSSLRSSPSVQEQARSLQHKKQLAQATTTLADGVRGLIKAYGNAATGDGIDGTIQFEKINGQQGPDWNAVVKSNGDVLISDAKGNEVAQFNLYTKEVKQSLSQDNARAFVKAAKAHQAQKAQQSGYQQPKSKSIAPKRKQKELQA